MIFIIIILSAVLVCGAAYFTGSYRATHSKPPALAPEPKGPTPELPTRNERWLMEQEHLLDPTGVHQHVGCRVCGPGPLRQYEVPSRYDHVFLGDVMYTDDYGWNSIRQGRVATPAEAEVVSSQIEGTKNWHTPMIDLDMPVRVLETSTPGHHHLYIDKPVKWRPYKKMLRAMYKAGVVERGFYKASRKHRATHLRPPWVEKN